MNNQSKYQDPRFKNKNMYKAINQIKNSQTNKDRIMFQKRNKSVFKKKNVQLSNSKDR